jgi:hypothetical protein
MEHHSDLSVNIALEAVAVKILDEPVNHCVAGAPASGDEDMAAETTRELLRGRQLPRRPGGTPCRRP